jgi:T-complex protein 1 subunit delta
MGNIAAAVAVSDVIRTSLGPRGLDKMIQLADAKKTVVVTNDGATILRHLPLLHPAAQLMAKLSEAQETAAGDGTTTVVVLAGALLLQAQQLLTAKGLPPSLIADAFRQALHTCLQVVERIGTPVDVDNREQLVKCAMTALHSKIVSTSAPHLASVAAQASLLMRGDDLLQVTNRHLLIRPSI